MGIDRSFETELNEEVEERLALMEEPDYQFPAALRKSDWRLIAMTPVVCLVLLIAGTFL